MKSSRSIKNIALSIGITLVVIGFVWAGSSVLLPALVWPVVVFAVGVDLLFLAAIWGEQRS
jgi:predicted acyltransferase